MLLNCIYLLIIKGGGLLTKRPQSIIQNQLFRRQRSIKAFQRSSTNKDEELDKVKYQVIRKDFLKQLLYIFFIY